MLYDCTYMRYLRVVKFIEIECAVVVVRDWGRQE
jgi:hypothetical protein